LTLEEVEEVVGENWKWWSNNHMYKSTK
jgi:hypothetical protein